MLEYFLKYKIKHFQWSKTQAQVDLTCWKSQRQREKEIKNHKKQETFQTQQNTCQNLNNNKKVQEQLNFTPQEF